METGRTENEGSHGVAKYGYRPELKSLALSDSIQ